MPICNAKIVHKECLLPDTIRLTLDVSALGQKCLPGQFVHLKSNNEFILRRPISIMDAQEERIDLVIENRGSGTKALTALQIGEEINLLGPLGNGFRLMPEGKALVVGGGIGVAPLYYLARQLKACDTLLGFRSKERMILCDAFQNLAHGKTVICTDDGSFGTPGNVIGPLKEMLQAQKYDTVYCCGPTVMMKYVAQVCKEFGVDCQVSLEERMACGVGACLGCVCKIADENGEAMKRVCKDGPVFDGRKVIFD